MNKKIVYWLVALVFILAIAVVVRDLTTTKLGKLPNNEFAYSVEAYSYVNDSLISHKEVKQIPIRAGLPQAFAYSNGKLYLALDHLLQIITTSGVEVGQFALDQKPRTVFVLSDGSILIGFEGQLKLYSATGILLKESVKFKSPSLFKGITANESAIYVADAGSKEVRIFDLNLKEKATFQGESGVSKEHGFIIPSMHFALAFNREGELWVVNPGLHALQNYTNDGKLRGEWSNTSFEVDGFSGCCNPFFIAFLKDGRFVTSEKGMVRIKIHKESGELESVVAPPSAFLHETKGPALVVDENDQIIALDFERKMIRFFALKVK